MQESGEEGIWGFGGDGRLLMSLNANAVECRWMAMDGGTREPISHRTCYGRRDESFKYIAAVAGDYGGRVDGVSVVVACEAGFVACSPGGVERGDMQSG